MQPLFAAFLVVGHYKETQNNYIVTAVLNIVISVLEFNRFDLIKVAIHTV